MSPSSDPLPSVRLTEPIRTERLILRLFTNDDFEAVYDMQSRPEVARYLYWSPRDRTGAAKSLREKLKCSSIKAEGDILNLAVERAEGGPAIGDLMLHYVSATHRQAEVGYIFHPEAQGQGLATEATRAIVDLAFSQLKVHRVYGQIDARNTASARVLERVGERVGQGGVDRRGDLRRVGRRVGPGWQRGPLRFPK
jgi:RimJ/RimL family protein N-acetyltransferase